MPGSFVSWLISFKLLLLPVLLAAQFSVGVTLGGLGWHFEKGPNVEFYKWKISKNGLLTGYGGVTFSASYQINDYVGIKLAQSLVFHDSAGKFTGITNAGIELHDDIVGLRSPTHRFSACIGPFWYYRKGWSDIPKYKNDPDFLKVGRQGKWERKFIWYGGFLRYNYSLDDQNDLSIDLLPAVPHVTAISLGVNRKY
jgi:hypothetical protein